jgi:hypothetical protein
MQQAVLPQKKHLERYFPEHQLAYARGSVT